MIWTPASLARWAVQAGWDADEAVAAVALALAVSGGDDAYHELVLPGPIVDRRGLYGIDVAARPEYLPVDLYAPAMCTTVAHLEWVRAGGQFGWSPVFGSQGWRDAIPLAVVAVHAPTAPEPAAPFLGDAGLADGAVAASRAWSDVADYIHAARIEGSG